MTVNLKLVEDNFRAYREGFQFNFVIFGFEGGESGFKNCLENKKSIIIGGFRYKKRKKSMCDIGFYLICYA
jgi:hypothetical protein